MYDERRLGVGEGWLAPCDLTLSSVGTAFIIIGRLFKITSAAWSVFGPKTAEVT